jgi:site-specific recombinase XerD
MQFFSFSVGRRYLDNKNMRNRHIVHVRIPICRHACGYALANRGHTRALQAFLGHRNIQHTVRYTELSPSRLKDFWRQ